MPFHHRSESRGRGPRHGFMDADLLDGRDARKSGRHATRKARRFGQPSKHEPAFGPRVSWRDLEDDDR